MRVFVLCSGRCGSTTFYKACRHIANYTAGHESNNRKIDGRLGYRDNHIEVDNRLAWMLATLGKGYEGDDVLWVHLRRNETDTVRSLIGTDLRSVFQQLLSFDNDHDPEHLIKQARFLLRIVTDSIEVFLRDKPSLEIYIEDPRESFRLLWEKIDAVGDFEAAMKEFDIRYNASGPRDDD